MCLLLLAGLTGEAFLQDVFFSYQAVEGPSANITAPEMSALGAWTLHAPAASAWRLCIEMFGGRSDTAAAHINVRQPLAYCRGRWQVIHTRMLMAALFFSNWLPVHTGRT